jgi:hypothetical protein
VRVVGGEGGGKREEGGESAGGRRAPTQRPSPLSFLSGVVQLFNAVAKAQRDARSAEAAGAKAAGAAAAGKAAFLAALRGDAPDAAPAALPPGARPHKGGGDAGGATGWDVLRPDFDARSGAKLKEWDARAAGAGAGPVGDALGGSSSDGGSGGEGGGGW